ncbi:MAG: superoxide dismutase family protein [Novosphingobium sp.]|nr:superoxide dismutase family protein [Novosphingobium sp.]
MKKIAATVLAASLLASCSTVSEPTRKIIATATLLSPDGSIMGNATIAAVGSDRLALHVDARNVPAGSHGTHLHETGRCAPRDFKSAGGHLNPFGAAHGTLNPKGSHLGDLPNLQVAPDGTGTLDIGLMGSRKNLEPAIFDADGTAIVIHAGPDDYATDPSGASGGRIACGVFARVR